MAICLLLFIAAVIGNQILTSHQANALESTSSNPKRSVFGLLLNFAVGSLKSIPKLLNPPKTTNSSIKYLLYTPDNPDTPCYLQPNLEALKRCPFHSAYPMKFLIHGFLSTIHPGGKFMMIKDALLKNHLFNVIIMDWSQYNQPPYLQAAANTRLVGQELANLIQFLQKAAGVDAKKIHLIGHSLGAHLSGVAGQKIPNLGRITGLDPAARFFFPYTLLHTLTHSDADFVDIIHSSNHLQGFGEEKPMGHLDFYPNGGKSQPQCQKESNSLSFFTKKICNHSAAVLYFLYSVNPSNCNFLASTCDFQNGLCSNDSSPIVVEMGLQAKPISGLSPKSALYLRTKPNLPYCSQNGSDPK